jgi:dTDP-4-amino-4,6-dideoxygalactose transaminase
MIRPMSRTAGILRADVLAQREQVAHEIDVAIQRVLSSGTYILGPELEAFEVEFAAYCGVAHCVGTASGTDALRLAATASGIGPGQEVITVSHTMAASVFALELAGATPVLVDIDPATYTIDPARVSEVVRPATRALLPVHLYGQCADMAPLLELAERHGLVVLEDAAQAHGATYAGRRAGALGTVGCFSFYPTKNLGAYGDAGAIVTDDAELAARVRLLRNHGKTDTGAHVAVAGNSRLDEVQAAILRVKLAHLDDWNAARRRHAVAYAEQLAGLPVTLPHADARGEHVFHLYVLRTRERDRLRAHLEANGVETGIHYPRPVHLEPAYPGDGADGALGVTEACAGEILSLPMYPELSDAAVERVSALVHDFFENGDRRVT